MLQVKKKEKNLISPSVFKGQIKTIFNLAKRLGNILTVLTVFCIIIIIIVSYTYQLNAMRNYSL
jgi:hypothetical protein